MKKNNFNPFLLWGSYVGASIPLLFAFYLIVTSYQGGFSPSSFSLAWGFVFVGMIIGFLVGWGIHYLIKK